MKTTEHRREQAKERHMETALGKLTPRNQEIVRRMVLRRANAGLKVNSNHAFVFSLRHMDKALQGKPLDQVTPEEVEDAVALLRRRLSPASVFMALRNFRRALAMLSPNEEVPKGILRAINVRRPVDISTDRLLSDGDFHALLSAAAAHRSGRTTTAPDESVALCWTLWDTGFRAHELLALRIESVALEPDGIGVLTLPPDAPLLKTGPRTIAVAECVRPLQAWMSMHPAAGNPKAPLFPGFYDKTGLKPLGYQSLGDHLRLLGRRSGIANPPARADITPHDLRHTCATRKARAGWVESQLRLFFGWRPGSSMPSKYVHLALSDLRDRVRRDFGLTAVGFPAVAPASDSELLVQLLRRLSQGQEPTRTSAPALSKPDAPQR